MPDSSAVPVTVATGIAAKGSWVQLIASTSEAYKALLIAIGSDNGNGALVDIGIGGAGSETVLIPNLMHHGRSTNLMQALAAIPIAVPAGSRISARGSASAAINLSIVASGIKDAFVTFDGMDTLLAATAYYGTTVTSGTAPTPGSYAQLVASTSRDYDAVVPMFSNNGTYASNNRRAWFDFATGAASSEVPFISNIGVGDEATGDLVEPMIGPIIRKFIPSGTRLSARSMSTGNQSTVSCTLGLLYGARFADLSGPLAL